MTEDTRHHWPVRTLVGDLIRGGLSLSVSLLVLIITPVFSWLFLVVCAVVVMFGLYFAESVSRMRMTVTAHTQGVRVDGGLFGPREIAWAALETFELRHFALGRQRGSGWMDLKLKGNGHTISVDDRMTGFSELLAMSWRAALTAGVGVSDTTIANLRAMGLNVDGH